MGPVDLLLHLIGFAAPALAVAVLVAFAARLILPGTAAGTRWWAHFAINSIAGLLVLAAGLWHFGVDGKMATYAALVVAVASSQWICSRAWRG
jgi:hypothetical protein